MHALPVFHALRAAHPRARLGWVVQREFAPLLEGLPGLDEVLVFERRGGAHAWLELGRRLARFGATWSVDAQGNLKSAMVALTSRAQRRSGYAWSDWRERLGALSLTDAAAPAVERAATAHAVERALALARYVAGADVPARFDLGLSEAERAHGRATLAERAPAGAEPLVLLAPARESDVRSWPVAHFAALAHAAARAGLRVLVLSGPAEVAEGSRLQVEAAGHARITHWVAQRGLRELAGVFAAAAEQDARFVGCDSGPLHLAAASGLACVALHGPQDPRRTGPWPPPGARDSAHRCVGAAAPPACAPCLSRRCTHARGPVCMGELAPERVLDTLLAYA
ncbi:MAG TPA: glycosyltransferase family 9 protein [Planctomycetota bacterium]|nr:glycosyltransferase family 9 protein [Planctomycetota bacterium]